MRNLIQVPSRMQRPIHAAGELGVWSPGPKQPDTRPSDPPTRPDEDEPAERPYETPPVPSMPELPLPSDPPDNTTMCSRAA